MDNMLVWMLIFAGATIGLLAVFLIASERELRIKRREIETLANQSPDSTNSTLPDEINFEQQADVSAIRKLETENKQLREEIETFNTKLDESENRVRELDAKVRGFTNILAENDQLGKRNEELQDEITALKNQIQENQSREDPEKGQHKALEDKCTALESELTKIKADLSESQSHLPELTSAQAQLKEAEARERQVTDRCADLETRLAELTEQIAANQERLMQYDSLQTQLREVENRYEQVRAENEHFQEEISRWQERLGTSSDTTQRLETIRQRLDGLNAKQSELTGKHGDIRQEMLALTQLLNEALQSRSDPADRIKTSELTSSQRSLPSASHNEQPSLDAAKKHIERGAYEEALEQLEQLLKDFPENQEIRLYRLLASVRLHHVEGYEKQIDAIAEIADLSDSERLIARDIFLARAENAQRCGRDDEMLRYRTWAKNVIYRTPFGPPEHAPSSHVDTAHNGGESASAEPVNPSGHTDLSAGTTTGTSNGTERAESPNGKGRVIVSASVIGVLVFVGAMFSGLFNEPKNITVPPRVGVQKSGTNPINSTSEDNPPLSTHPSIVEEKLPTVDAAPKKNTSDPQPSGAPSASQEKKVHTARSQSNTSGVTDSPVKESQEHSKQREQTAGSLASSLRGAYEVVRPTQVLSEPRSGSALIANIDRGTRVSVVADRDGWLEIRSKYGRPPGFIRRDAAARIQ